MNRTTISLFWQFIDRFSVQGIQFLIGIVLSRLLSPNDYGIVGIIMVLPFVIFLLIVVLVKD